MNRYAAPNAPLDENTPSSSATAVLIGAAIGNGISYAVLFVFGLVFLWSLALQGVPTQDLYVKAHQSTSYLAFAHVVGFLCLIPGGYWSARLSPHKPLLTALLAGGIVAAFTATANLIPYELPIPLWSRITSVVTAFPAFALGAAWRQRAA
jgi:hypothetical protein